MRALELPPPARALVREAGGDARVREAIRGLMARLAVDGRATRPTEHFRWAMEVADRPAGVALEVLRYLSGPAIADVAAIPPGGESGARLHYRALRRRLGGAVAREGS